MRSQDFLLLGCTSLPQKVDDLFLVVVVTLFQPALHVQMSKQRGKIWQLMGGGRAGDRGGPPSTTGATFTPALPGDSCKLPVIEEGKQDRDL